MPIRKIEETENTGLVQLTSVSNTVYIPGSVKTTPIAPKLFKNKSDLDAAIKKGDYEDDLSAKLAKRCLQLGLYVLFEGCSLTDNQPDINWNRLNNKTLYNIKFLTTGGYACPSSDMVECATKRGDCCALIDHASDIDYTNIDTVRKAFESYADEDGFTTGFTPWWKSESEVLGGSAAKEVLIPGCFGYLFAYANSVKTNPGWLPVAGASRGIIPDLTGVAYEYSEANINELQCRTKLDEDDDNVGIAINPIAYMGESFGYLIWGNRTLIQNEATKKTTARSFLNVRNLISELKKNIEAASLKYTFEPNNDLLWINWQAYLIPVLNKMESGAGILGYKLIRQKTSAKARLKARVIIIPIEGVEDFDITVELSDSLDITE